MTADGPTGESLRPFVALELPDDARHTLAAWAAAAVPDGMRLVDERSLHLTLAFLGSSSRMRAGAVARTAARDRGAGR